MFDPRVSVLIILIIKPNLKWFTEFGFGTNLKNKKVFLPFFIYNVHKSQFTCFVFCMWAIHLHSKGSPSWPGLNINRSWGRWNWLSTFTPPLNTKSRCMFVLLLARMLCIVSDWIGVSGSWVKITILKSVVHVNRGWGWLTIAFDFL